MDAAVLKMKCKLMKEWKSSEEASLLVGNLQSQTYKRILDRTGSKKMKNYKCKESKKKYNSEKKNKNKQRKETLNQTK
jgi:hypothetical protein